MPRYSTLIPQISRSSQRFVMPQLRGDLHDRHARHDKCRQRRDELHDQIEIEQEIEDDRTQDDEHEPILFERRRIGAQPGWQIYPQAAMRASMA